MRAERERRAAEDAGRARATLTERIYFDFDRSDIRSDMGPLLDAKVRVLMADRSIRLQVDGHADDRGSDEYNLALGMRRGLSVKNYLVRFGVEASRLSVRSFGEEQPLDPQHNERAWSRNRRVEFGILAGMASDR